jgi:hypothetical protein
MEMALLPDHRRGCVELRNGNGTPRQRLFLLQALCVRAAGSFDCAGPYPVPAQPLTWRRAGHLPVGDYRYPVHQNPAHAVSELWIGMRTCD